MTKKLMAVLVACLCLTFISTTKVQAAQSPQEVQKAIITTAVKMGVDPFIALSIAKLESGFNPYKKAPSGAVGTFQLMPDTARRLGVNPHLPNDNIKGGIMYYQMMYKKYGSMDLALAAYNAGPGNVARYKGVPPFKETHAFINKIKKEYSNLKADPFIKNAVSNPM